MHLLALLLPACSTLTCGPGTVEKDDQCVPVEHTGAPEDTGGGADSGDPDDTGGGDTGGGDTGGGDTGGGGEPGDGPRFAPFVDATLYPVAKIAEIASETGVMWYHLGFVVAPSSGACEATWGTYYTLEDGPDSWGADGQYFLYDQIDLLRAAGGDVIVSLGGAASTPVEVACTDEDELVSELRRVVDTLDLQRLDFDVEGAWLADDESVTRRNRAIARLQDELAEEGRDLEVWFTLPVLPSGLTDDGVALVESALAEGVEIGGVNVMAMDYGDGAAPDPDGRMGEYAIDAATALHAQLMEAWEGAGRTPDADALWAKVGVTPMIGLNDVTTEIFYLEDAAELRAFALEAGLGLLSMWSMNRDHPCPDTTWVDTTCSSSPDQTEDWAFSAALGG